MPRKWDKEPTFTVIRNVFTPTEATTIVDLHHETEPIVDRMQGKEALVRDSNIHWISYERTDLHWIFDRLDEMVKTWNDTHFQFEIKGVPPLLQLTGYGEGQHYNWHADLGSGRASRRKASITVLISDKSNFDGGDLEFFKTDVRRPIANLNLGDAVIFPPWMKHRVTPVTRGLRWSLVTWFQGPPFR